MTAKGARYRLDDLRRLATELGERAGLPRAPGAALAKHLLWFDSIGDSGHGIGTFPGWLDRLSGGELDPKSDGRVGQEHASTANLEARRGLPPLVLVRAAEIAGQKARDTGMGLVHVSGLAPMGPTTPLAAELAIGPHVGLVLGPGPEQSAALPSAEGLPLVYDSRRSNPEAQGRELAQTPGPDPAGLLAPWALLASGADVIIVALAVTALESLGSFQERVGAILDGHGPAQSPGWLQPKDWEENRRSARERGVPLTAAAEAELRSRSGPLGIAFPDSLPG